MCFDLMQEEIVAKFRWIGTKIGIVDKPEENNDPIDKTSLNQEKRNTLTNENGHDSPTPRISSGTRKSSPRNNIARVHPQGSNSPTDGTLHQRTASSKSY
jgi:hypothetical protein